MRGWHVVGGGQSNLPGMSCTFQFNSWISSSDKLKLQSWSIRAQRSNVRVMPGREIQGRLRLRRMHRPPSDHSLGDTVVRGVRRRLLPRPKGPELHSVSVRLEHARLLDYFWGGGSSRWPACRRWRQQSKAWHWTRSCRPTTERIRQHGPFHCRDRPHAR
jgi:hypothetical protein